MDACKLDMLFTGRLCKTHTRTCVGPGGGVSMLDAGKLQGTHVA